MRKVRLLMLLCVALGAGVWLAHAQEARAGRTSTRYLIFFEPGPSWDYGSDFRLQAGFAKHLAYFKRLYRKKKVTMVGTVTGKPLALVLAPPGASRAELKAMAQGDPMVKKDVLTFKVRQWKLDFERTDHKVFEDDISDVDLEDY